MKKLILKWLGLGNTTVVIGEEKISVPLVSTIQIDIAHLQEDLRCARWDHRSLEKRVRYLEERTLVLQYLEIVDDDEILIHLNHMMKKYDEYFSNKLNKKLQGRGDDDLNIEDVGNNLSNSIVKECIVGDYKGNNHKVYTDAWKAISRKLREYTIDNTKKITVIKENINA